MNPPFDPTLIGQAHALYCRLTGQSLSLRYDRERLWYEVLRAGHTLADVEHLIRYLQREIRATRRQVGALQVVQARPAQARGQGRRGGAGRRRGNSTKTADTKQIVRFVVHMADQEK